MFKNFRETLQFPIPYRDVSRTEIEKLFRQGKFMEAYKLCKRLGSHPIEFQEAIEKGAQKAYFSRGIGSLMTFLYETGIHVQYDPVTLLTAMFNANDYHGFLKQAHRFEIYIGIEKEIEMAIEKLIEKRQVANAEAWHRKFRALRNNQDL